MENEKEKEINNKALENLISRAIQALRSKYEDGADVRIFHNDNEIIISTKKMVLEIKAPLVEGEKIKFGYVRWLKYRTEYKCNSIHDIEFAKRAPIYDIREYEWIKEKITTDFIYKL